MKHYTFAALLLILLLAVGCSAPTVKLFSDASDPLREFTLMGSEEDKVLLITVRGIITDDPKEGFLRSRPSLVQEVVSQLKLAAKDKKIKALVIKINSPGGTVTASDILYRELSVFKQKTGTRLVISMFDVAASGAYYISLPADVIMAHPTTITGSVGVIFIRPKITGLMEKIGLNVEVNKSGQNKDMGSPFRPTTAEEQKILQEMSDEMGAKFIDLVMQHRQLNSTEKQDVSTARIYLAEEAVKKGLVDEIGYLTDAINRAKELAGIDPQSKVIVYRRSEYPNDTIYNPMTTQTSEPRGVLIDTNLDHIMPPMQAGFYYLWPSAFGR
ncbi:MAG: signal peptide peptidase SppA [Desulfobacterales bacterium]|nr:signal peptide peptidase SppA [Desulfobacterales bacterium]